ncbi:hypothetical protein B0H34DRAFT_794160 [Crassisporium funariophilum]|nr:hypothetical protein B0H34DRAFT_794160 [Crassisporium funariophilum]
MHDADTGSLEQLKKIFALMDQIEKKKLQELFDAENPTHVHPSEVQTYVSPRRRISKKLQVSTEIMVIFLFICVRVSKETWLMIVGRAVIGVGDWGGSQLRVEPDVSHIYTLQPKMYACNAGCGQFFNTSRAVNSHLSLAQSCAWYMKGKRRELDIIDIDNPAQLDQNFDGPSNLPGEDWETFNPFNDPDINFDLDKIYQSPNNLHFISNNPVLSEMGPGPQPAATQIQEGAS